MQSNIELLKEALAAVEAGDMEKLSSLTADDMTLEGPVPEPLPKAAYLGLMGALTAGIPDWKFNASGFVEKGDQVSVTFSINGTHTGVLSLPMLPQPFPATGKRFQMPAEHIEFTVKGDKVSRIKLEVIPGGGVMGILAQLGVAVPSA